MITTAVCAVFAAGLCALFIVRIVRRGRLVPLLKAAAVAALLNLFTIVPLATHAQNGVSAQMMPRLLTANVLSVRQLLLGSLSGQAITLGLPLVLSTIVAILCAAAKTGQRSASAVCLLIAGVAFALMTTALCPWRQITAWTRGAAAYIQFPWRLLSMATCCLSFAGGHALARLCGRGKRGVWLRLGALALCAAAVSPQLLTWTQSENVLAPNRPKLWDALYADYTLTDTVISQMKDMQVHTDGDVTLSDYEKFGTQIVAGVRSETGGEVSFPLFAFAGYAAELDGERVDILRGENNRIALSVPAHTDGLLHIWFEGKASWRAAEAVSLLTACLMLADAAVRRRRRA